MRRARSILLPIALAAGLAASVMAVASGQASSQRVAVPEPSTRWVLHAQRHPGSLSGTVEVQANPDLAPPGRVA